MPDRSPSHAETVWRRRAAHLALKLNFHHWLARVVPNVFVVAVLFTLLELFRREASLPTRWSAAFLLLGSGVALGWAWLQARRHFCTWEQALVRLETVLGLHNQLSAAQAGVLPWPEVRSTREDGYVENWKLILLPLLLGAAFGAVAHFVPIHHLKMKAGSDLISEPPELTQVQNWINALKAADLVQPDRLQDMQSSLNKLRDRPPQDWYTQSNLEAANSLKELTEQSMTTLAHDLDQADQAVQSMQNSPGSSSAGDSLKPMQDQLRKADENMTSGNLPLNKELIDQLHGAETAHDANLSAAQLKALHDRLQKGKLAAHTAPKSNGGVSQEMEQAMAAAAQGQGAGRRKFMPGPGGIGGGKETAPLALQSREKTSPEGALTPVSNDDMSRASIGETLKITAGNQNVDPAAYGGNQTAGSAQTAGSGGEAVWRSTYDPQDADTLTRFFK